MNEELSSTNEELHAINDELWDRTNEVDQVNAYLESVLTSLDASVIVIDDDLRVQVWNGRSFEMWGLRAEEVEGKPFLGLDIGFPVEELRAPLVATLVDEAPPELVHLAARSRRGDPVQCAARVRPLRGPSGKVEGAIVVIEEAAGS